jgi:hypothetical protein
MYISDAPALYHNSIINYSTSDSASVNNISSGGIKQKSIPTADSQVEICSAPRPQAALPIWQSLPLNVPLATDLDEAFRSVTLAGCQRARNEGTDHSELSEPSFPSVTPLLSLSGHIEASADLIATAVARFALNTSLKSFSRKAAFHYTIAHLLLWPIKPSEDNFRQLPTFTRPTILQRTITQPAWIDAVPW